MEKLLTWLPGLLEVAATLLNIRYRRWHELLNAHGVNAMDAFSLIGKDDIPLTEFRWPWHIAGRLTNDVILSHARIFNVQPDWITGRCDRRYTIMSLDHSLLSSVQELIAWSEKGNDPTLLVFRSGDEELEENPRQNGALVLRITVRTLGEQPLYAYLPIYTLQDWGDAEQRFLAIRAIWIAWRMGFFMEGHQANGAWCERIAEGRVFPAPELVKLSKCWHPDDYVVRPSCVAKATWIDHIIEEYSNELDLILAKANYPQRNCRQLGKNAA